MIYQAIGRTVRKSLDAAAHLLGAVWCGVESLRLYNELERMDDENLAALGLTREGIGAYVAALIEPVTLASIAASRPVGPAAADSAANEATAEDALQRRAA